MIDSLGDVGAVLIGADPESLERLYGQLRLELLYHPLERTVDARLAPCVVSACVRGGLGHRLVAPARKRVFMGRSVAQRSAGVDQRVGGSLAKSRNSATLAG
jgi:hypothetical protein